MSNCLLTQSMIRKEAALLITMIHEPHADMDEIHRNVSCDLAYSVHNDRRPLHIGWLDRGELRIATSPDVEASDLQMSLDNFSDRILRPLIVAMKPAFDPR